MASTGCVSICSVWLCGGSGGLSYNFKVPLLIELNGMDPENGSFAYHFVPSLVDMGFLFTNSLIDCVHTM